MNLFINILEAFGALVALVFGTYGVFVETTFEKQDGHNTGKRKGSRLNRNGKIILAGVFVGGMISLITKIVSGVSDYRSAQDQLVIQGHINDSLKVANRKEQEFKYQVDTSLRSTLASLNTISSKADDITNQQGKNLVLQEQQLYNTKKILAPVNPLSLTFVYSTPAVNPAMQNYYERMLALKENLENKQEVDRNGLIVSTQRNGKVKAIQIRNPRSEFFPTMDDDTGLGLAFDSNDGETIKITDDHLNMIGLLGNGEGLGIDVPASFEDSVHNVSFIVNISFTGGQPETDTISVVLNCDITDKSLINATPKAPAFNSIYDLTDKYISVYGRLTTIFNLEKLILLTGPDKRVTTLHFTETNKFVDQYLGTRKYYQQKVLAAIFK